MSANGTPERRLGEVLSNIQMPLENLAWTIDEYLLANGPRLDAETRFLLAGARDCADRIAGSVKKAASQGKILGGASRTTADSRRGDLGV